LTTWKGEREAVVMEMWMGERKGRFVLLGRSLSLSRFADADASQKNKNQSFKPLFQNPISVSPPVQFL
jgi:hypothetical protein